MEISKEQREQYYDFLDDLRDSGITNMFGAVPYLRKAFNIDEDVARKILTDWMSSYGDRHPNK